VAIELIDEEQQLQDLSAIVIETAVEAGSSDEAIEKAGPLLNRLLASVGALQMGRGQPLVTMTLDSDGWLEASYFRMTPTVNTFEEPLEVSIERLQRDLEESPQGELYANLFAEACRDGNLASSISRMWFLLEALADRFKGHDIDRVRKLVKHLGYPDPLFGPPPTDLIRAAYDTRVAFTHRGEQRGSGSLQVALARLTLLVLLEARFGSTDPLTSPRPEKTVRFVSRRLPKPGRVQAVRVTARASSTTDAT
jgi:hypothetical protein